MKNYFKNIGESLIIPAKLIPSLAIILYFSGWLYINAYYSAFNFNRSSFSFTEYTTILYSFSVIIKIPFLIFERELEGSIGVILLLLMLANMVVTNKLVQRFPKASNLSVLTWIFLIIGLIFISQAAGEYDARKIIKNKGYRRVDVFFTESFKRDLAANEGQESAEQKIDELRLAAIHDGLVLIKRDDIETTLLLLETADSDLYGEPIEIIRLNSSQIAFIKTKPYFD